MSKKKGSNGQGEHVPLPRVRTTPEVFGKRLADLLKVKGMSQSELAAAIWGRGEGKRGENTGPAIKRDLISAYIKGEMLPSTVNAQKIANALGVPYEELIPTINLTTDIDEGVISRVKKPGHIGCYVWNAKIVVDKAVADFLDEFCDRVEQARKRGETLKLPRW